MYCDPNSVAIPRSSNFSFTAVSTESYHNYYISSNNEQIVLSSSHNNSHIFVDLYVPSVVKILFFYEIHISSYDIEGNSIENGTFYFVIGNLTDDELFHILSKYKQKEIEIEEKEQEIENLKNTNNTTNTSVNASAWEGFDFTSSVSKYVGNILTNILTALLIGSIAIIGIVTVKHTTNKQIEEKNMEKDLAEMDRNRAIKTSQAVAFSADTSKPQKVDGELREIPILNIPEKETLNKYVSFYDVSRFLIPKNKEKMSSIDQFYKMCKKHKIDKFDKYFLMSAIIKYLDREGYKEENNEIFPVNCNLKEIKDEFENIKAAFNKAVRKRAEKKKEKEADKENYEKYLKNAKKAKDITPKDSQIIEEIEYELNY
jgi:hypothetical protein